MGRTRGYNRKNRRLYRANRKDLCERIKRSLNVYSHGQRVILKICSSHKDSHPHRRYHGLNGIVRHSYGYSSEVIFKNKNFNKILKVSNIHLVSDENIK